MTPERRNLLTRAVDLIRAASNTESFDAAATRADLIRLARSSSTARSTP
jgi:hypothetical protein